MSTNVPNQYRGKVAAAGSFVRQESVFRDWVTADGSSGFKAEPDRYHLYISHSCPWAHRVVITRKLKKLQEAVSMTVADPIRDARGWRFTDEDGCEPDPINGYEFLAEAYLATDPSYSGRITVPVLWDTRDELIVNNESSEIIRMLNSEFDEWADSSVDFYPEPLRAEIDTINEIVYENVNDGVYRTGFARTQTAYEVAFELLFKTLDELDERLGRQRYLVRDTLTEADWRLFATTVRFDAVYVGHFKCDLRRLTDYPNLWAYTRELYQYPGVAETVNMDHIKRHYFMTHSSLNPTRTVPKGPDIDFLEPHGREKLGSSGPSESE